MRIRGAVLERIGAPRRYAESQPLKVTDLDGLRAVDSAPVIQNARVFFTTNENTIECLPLESSQEGGKWPITVSAGIATECMVDQGRVAVIDRENVLHCWEQVSGSRQPDRTSPDDDDRTRSIRATTLRHQTLRCSRTHRLLSI